MKDDIEMNSKEHVAPSYDTLSTTSSEAPWNLQISAPTVKQETVECIDGEESSCNDDMYPSEPLEPSKFVNYCDNKDYALELLKKEFPEDVCPQSHVSMSSKIVIEYPSEPLEPSKFVNYYDSKQYALEQLKKEFPEDECPQSHYPSEPLETKFVNDYDNKDYALEQQKKEFPEYDCPQSHNMELLKVIDEQEIKQENTKERLSLKLKNVNKMYQVPIKMERLEEQDILNNAGATSIHYDVLVTPRVVQCKLCGRIFKNSFNLLMHNNGHIKVEISTPGDSEMNDLHQYQYCDKAFNNNDSMLAHFGDVNSQINPKVELFGKQLQNSPSFKRHVALTQQVTKNRITCKYCNAEYKYKKVLYNHMKLCRTAKGEEKIKYKCEPCERIYTTKRSLILHRKVMHYDYGRTFECWCGKQFRTPIHLGLHMKRQHDGKMKDIDNDPVQCDTCQQIFKTKYYLEKHMKKFHYDYGRTFECWCGIEFRTPTLLTEHKRIRHGSKNEVYKCEYCEAVYNVKNSLIMHTKRVHYEYGRMFECSCGKQFRTPIHLREHMRRQHVVRMSDKAQCNSSHLSKNFQVHENIY